MRFNICNNIDVMRVFGTVLEDVAPHQLVLLQLLRRGVSGVKTPELVPRKWGGQRLILTIINRLNIDNSILTYFLMIDIMKIGLLLYC